MLSLVAVCALLSPVQETPAPAAPQPEARPVDALVRACQPLADAESYRFTMSTESEGGGGFGGRGGGGGGPQLVTGSVAKDQPIHLKTGQGELFVLGEKVAMTDEEGAWIAPPARGGPGGGRGRGEGGGGAGAGRGAGGGPGGAGGGDRGDRRRGGTRGGPARMLRSFKPPHTLVTDLDQHVLDVVREESDDGKVVFTGKLSESAIGTLAGSGFGGRGGRGGGFGGDVDMQQTGTFTATLDAQGALHEVAYSVRTEAFFGDREIDRTRTTRFTLADFGATEVVVPEAAAKLLGIAKDESEEDWF